MANTKKIFTVQNLAEKFKQAKGLILSDYSGLNVDQINKLRGEIKKAGGEFEVVKNNLLRLAAKNSQLFSISNFQLEGPTAALWLYNQDFSPLKVLDNFIRQTELPKIKFGFWEGEEIAQERISELANLPGKEQLRAKLVGLFQSPLSQFLRVLNFNTAKLIFILKTKAEGGENNLKFKI